jgi:hypothetical protein
VLTSRADVPPGVRDFVKPSDGLEPSTPSSLERVDGSADGVCDRVRPLSSDRASVATMNRLICSRFLKPSDRLEPSTPSLPSLRREARARAGHGDHKNPGNRRIRRRRSDRAWTRVPVLVFPQRSLPDVGAGHWGEDVVVLMTVRSDLAAIAAARSAALDHARRLTSNISAEIKARRSLSRRPRGQWSRSRGISQCSWRSTRPPAPGRQGRSRSRTDCPRPSPREPQRTRRETQPRR